MKLSYHRSLTGREINKARAGKVAPMYNAFQDVWGDICKALSYHGVNPLSEDVVVTFTIDWECERKGG